MYHNRAMRSFWCLSVMISVLFMSVDGAADVASTDHPYGGAPAYFVDKHTGSSPATGLGSTLDVDHCEHCCHGHTSSITGHVSVVVPVLIAGDYQVRRAPHVRNLAQAPPTPPPKRVNHFFL